MLSPDLNEPARRTAARPVSPRHGPGSRRGRVAADRRIFRRYGVGVPVGGSAQGEGYARIARSAGRKGGPRAKCVRGSWWRAAGPVQVMSEPHSPLYTLRSDMQEAETGAGRPAWKRRVHTHGLGKGRRRPRLGSTRSTA